MRATLCALLLAAAGAACASAWSQGLYATALLAVIVAAWVVALVIVDAAPRRLPSPPPPAVTASEEERRALTAYLDLSPAPLVARDGDRLRVVNRAARRLFGADDLVADALPDLVAALDITTPGRTATVELADGSTTRSFALATGDLTVGGRILRIGALIDIDSELKAAEAAALRDLIQVLSHEIVNALTPIASLAQTAADMLGDPAPPLPAIREAVETVARRAQGLHRFGEAYRALARLPAPVDRRIAVAPFISDLERLFVTRWPGIALAVDTARAPAALRGDPDQLTAALWAILQNAAEALDATPEPRVSLTVTAAIGTTTITTTDNGPGIVATDADAIFRPFFTTKPAGTGVGLALARQILRGHGGDLTLDRGAGTCFQATVPSRP